jgi:hypothetical protein
LHKASKLSQRLEDLLVNWVMVVGCQAAIAHGDSEMKQLKDKGKPLFNLAQALL